MSGPPPELQASPRILHTALFAGALFITPMTAALRWVAPIVHVGPPTALVLRFIAIATLMAQAVVVRIVRNRIAPLELGGSEDAWWNAYLTSCLVIWGLGESLALLGSVFYFMTGDWLMLGVAGGGLLLLFLANPTRLMRD
ncbi:MAG: hypothetical protein HYS40_06850 [Gemmatimonadetes bacterium]|nr:hypothetical protein [Gemmatimonadota bacterium]